MRCRPPGIRLSGLRLVPPTAAPSEIRGLARTAGQHPQHAGWAGRGAAGSRVATALAGPARTYRAAWHCSPLRSAPRPATPSRSLADTQRGATAAFNNSVFVLSHFAIVGEKNYPGGREAKRGRKLGQPMEASRSAPRARELGNSLGFFVAAGFLISDLFLRRRRVDLGVAYIFRPRWLRQRTLGKLSPRRRGSVPLPLPRLGALVALIQTPPRPAPAAPPCPAAACLPRQMSPA